MQDDCVHYFNIDKGYDTADGQTAIDMDYMKYPMQDALPVKENGKTRYTFYADYAFRALFCKDVFLSNEQEYRIVLPNEKISGGKSYPIKLTIEYPIIDLDDFFA